MNLLAVRTQFVKRTGRYDLVVNTANYTDDGADFYIQAGQRMLDRMLEFKKDEAQLNLTLVTSAYSSTITRVRAVREVALLIEGTTDSLKPLPYASLRELRLEYGGLTTVTNGVPALWSLGFLRDGVTANTTTEATGSKLVFMPPADKTYYLKARVLLESNNLANNTSVSYWSQEHPDILVWAGMYKMEVDHRNREGATATLQHIREAVLQVSNDNIEQSQVDNALLGDSWRFIENPTVGFEREVNS